MSRSFSMLFRARGVRQELRVGRTSSRDLRHSHRSRGSVLVWLPLYPEQSGIACRLPEMLNIRYCRCRRPKLLGALIVFSFLVNTNVPPRDEWYHPEGERDPSLSLFLF